ncbi:hypothetical protein C1Y63_04985 [Corynebacterium sp. 13CS0277]|uniref:tyrosine-type recombinase/integrase n=1 Tax=Corynebacterium sp. 13CS0277 TaxID=2071994 RepID=UPI000D03B475|nr:site-specific integrase [Corynebacterium sp. 13CS0277]PRQ11767.1 hypothetical protein C1Y63_04985 [Corynebacterium sp. 13CS0277]
MNPTLHKGTVYRRGDYWVAQATIALRPDGSRIRRSKTCRTKTAARQALRELRREAQLRANPRELPLSRWCDTYLREYAHYRLNPRTAADHRSKIRRYINPTLGDIPVGSITPADVREFHAYVRKAGVSDRTVQIAHSVLSRILDAAVEEGILDTNPVARMQRPRAQSRRRDALTAEEAKRIITTAHDARDPLATLWTCALLTGARKGELIGLERDRVDVDAGVIDLSWQIQSIPYAHGPRCHNQDEHTAVRCPSRTLDIPPGFDWRPCNRTRVFTRPKTQASIRAIPIPEPARIALAEHLASIPGGPYNLVWPSASGRPLEDRYVTQRWREALDRAGVPRIDFHSARHTAASLLLEGGVSPEVIVQLLGHSSVLSTRRYLHVPQTMAREALGRLTHVVGLPAITAAP